MKERCLVVFLILVAIIHTGGPYSASDYSTILTPSIWGNTEINWRVVDCPGTPFSLYWSGQGHWLAQADNTMKLKVLAVGEDIKGTIMLGNKTWNANDTDIAKDLALGVWGLTPWLPGLIVEVGEQNLKELNDTAYNSAQRVLGNWVNGTMSSYYHAVTASGVTYNCVVFEYQQDNTSIGEPQRTYLAFDTVTGLLVKGNTSYSFVTPYRLSIEMSSIYVPSSVLPLVAVGLSVGTVVVIVGWLMRRRPTT